MTSLRRIALAALASIACAIAPRAASAAPVAPAVSVAADTTFKPEGSYTLTLAVEGQAMEMSFTVTKKADGTFAGAFRHAEMGEFPSTSFKVEGRKLSVGVETPGGPAMVTLTVNADNTVDGEWAMSGDGSKVAGKKNS